MISFISDQWEFATAEGMEEQGGVGFKLTYLQTDCWNEIGQDRPVSQKESTVKACMLDLKNSFSGHKVLLFLRQIGVLENGSAIEKRIGVRYSKREHK